MLPFLLSVIVISLSGVMLPGPMFAVTVAKSYKSPWTGAWLSLGHAAVEIPLILLIYFGFAQFFQHTPVQFGLSIAGGGMVIWLGVNMFRTRAEITQGNKELPYNAFTAGIITSGFNPFFLIWWATIGSMLVMKSLDFGLIALVLLIIIHWLCDFGWLLGASNLVYRTRTLWGRKVHEGVFIGCSLLLVGFGGWFMISGIQMVI